MRTKVSYNVDKLRLCYRQPDGLLDLLAEYRTNDYIQRDSYVLHIIDDGRDDTEMEALHQQIIANVILDDKRLLGSIQFNFSTRYKGLCFFDFENKMLYDKEIVVDEEKSNTLPYLDFVADDLGLTLNSITKLELAFDVSNNALLHVRKMVRDYEHYDMFVNGKKIVDEKQRIKDYGEFFERSRVKLCKYPTIYISQQKNQSPLLRIYNKTKEIDVSGKNYIEDWNEFGKTSFSRIEVSVNWQDFQKWIAYVKEQSYPEAWGEINLINTLLNTRKYKQALWEFFVNRLLYFRGRGSHKDMITLLDVAIEVA